MRKRYTEDVRQWLMARPNQHVHVSSLAIEFGINHRQVQNAISRVKQLFRDEDTNEIIKTIERGQTWMYVPYPDTAGEPQEHRVTVKLSQEMLDGVQEPALATSLSAVENELGVTGETRWWWHGMSSPEGELLLACDNGRYYTAREL
jgi:hypothetical protein